jgi:integrase
MRSVTDRRRPPGEGSIYQRADGKWIAQLSIGPRTARRYRKRTRTSYRDARRALVELRAERDRGLSPSRATLSGFLAAWVRDVRNLRPTTRHGYEVAIELHIAPLIGDVRLSQLTPAHVEHLLGVLAERLSPKSVRNVHAVLRRALGAAVRGGLLSRNVASREYVDAPRVPAIEPRSLTAAEVRRLLEATRGDRLEALFAVAVGTGLRMGELLGLAWEDVDLERGLLHVRRGVRYVPGPRPRAGRYVREELKTDRSRRVVPLAPALVDALAAHRERLIAEGFVPTATGPVFPNLRGGALSGSWLTHHFYDLLEAAGIPRLPFKNLRTTFASRLFEAGIPDRRVADLLGHTRTRTTHGHYIGATDEWAPAIAAVQELVG